MAGELRLVIAGSVQILLKHLPRLCTQIKIPSRVKVRSRRKQSLSVFTQIVPMRERQVHFEAFLFTEHEGLLCNASIDLDDNDLYIISLAFIPV